jgi:hypothetical protein
VDLFFKKDEIRVEKGQVIAFSGDTGSGPPHLHFEIRNRYNQPLNPLQKGLIVHDTIAPRITSIVLIPLDRNSSVNGFPVPQWYHGSSSDSSVFFLSGRIGIGAQVWDIADGSDNLLGVYQLSLAVDSTLVFSKQYDSISYNFSKYGGLDYIFVNRYGGNGFISALYRRTGNLVDFYKGKGILQCSAFETATHHTLTLSARDYSQNITSECLPVIFGERPIFRECGYTADGTFHITGSYSSGIIDRAEILKYTDEHGYVLEFSYPVMNKYCSIQVDTPHHQSKLKIVLVAKDSIQSLPVYLRVKPERTNYNKPQDLHLSTEMLHDRLVVRVGAQELLASLPVITVENRQGGENITLYPVPEGETSWITSIPFPQPGQYRLFIRASAYDMTRNPVMGKKDIDFTVLNMYTGSSVYAPDSLLSVHVSSQSLYRQAPMMITSIVPKPVQGLESVSSWYSIMLGDEPFRNTYRVNLALVSNSPDRGALYISGDYGNSWTYVSNQRKGKVYTGICSHSGYLAVLDDRTPPEVIPLTPHKESTVHILTPEIRIKVSDNGSGLAGSDSIIMTLDSVRVYGEYDYEAHSVKYIPYYELSAGVHEVSVTVTDRVGNATTQTWTFTCTE